MTTRAKNKKPLAAYKTKEFLLEVMRPDIEYTPTELRALMGAIGYEGPQLACVTSCLDRLIFAGVITARKITEPRGRIFMLAADADVVIRQIVAEEAPKQVFPLHSSPMAWLAAHCLGATA